MDPTAEFEQERPRLRRLATRVLADPGEAEDVVQQAWLRLHGTITTSAGEAAAPSAPEAIENLPAWLTTVTTRLCLDRLRTRVPVPVEPHDDAVAPGPDPAESAALAESVGIALHRVLDRLSPAERVAFVLHDSFGFPFATIAAALETTPAAARQLASRARAKVRQPAPEDRLAEWEVVDAFMAAAREGDFDRLLELLAPDATVTADQAAIATGTPERIEGRRPIAEFFSGSAHAALPVFAGADPGFAWYHRGTAMVLFDFEVADGAVRGIVFRAAPDALARVVRREGAERKA